MAAFERLQKIGEEKFRKILNHLILGKPAMVLAREIQQEWHEFQDVSEKAFTQQLNRLRIAAAQGMFGKHVANEIAKGHTPQVEALQHISSSALTRMEDLAQKQLARVDRIITKELKDDSFLPATNEIFLEYKNLLKDIQKMRFDLGADEFQGVVGTTANFRGTSTTIQRPDGSSVKHQVIESNQVANEIFRRRLNHEP